MRKYTASFNKDNPVQYEMKMQEEVKKELSHSEFCTICVCVSAYKIGF